MTASLRQCFDERTDCGHGTWDAVAGDHFGEHLAAALTRTEPSGLHDWLLAHEHHTLHFGREHGNVAGAIRCASPHDGDDPRHQRFAVEPTGAGRWPGMGALRAELDG